MMSDATKPKWKRGDKVMLLIDNKRDWWVPEVVVEVKNAEHGGWVVKLAGTGHFHSPSVVKDR